MKKQPLFKTTYFQTEHRVIKRCLWKTINSPQTELFLKGKWLFSSFDNDKFKPGDQVCFCFCQLHKPNNLKFKVSTFLGKLCVAHVYTAMSNRPGGHAYSYS